MSLIIVIDLKPVAFYIIYSFFALNKRIGRKALIQPPLPFNAHENLKKKKYSSPLISSPHRSKVMSKCLYISTSRLIWNVVSVQPSSRNRGRLVRLD